MTKFLAVARETLGRERVVLGAKLDWESLTAADAVLVVHPTARLQFGEASAFLSAGGRLAIVDDFGKADQLLSRFHIRRALAPTNPAESVGNNPRLPIARPFALEGDAAGGRVLRHPIVADVDQVATNHPSALETDPEVELTPVLTLRDRQGEEALFAVIGVIGNAQACGLDTGSPENPRARCGRLFAMADPSVFINLMMEFEGNRELARGMLQYLLEDDSWGQRRGKLFILANDFQQSGQFGGQADLQRRLESTLGSLQQLLDRVRADGLPTQLAAALAALSALVTALWVLRSSGKVYERQTPRFARDQPLVAQGGVAGRIAVLSAPSTHNALVVLELKAAAEEVLRQALRLPRHASSAAIVEALEQTGAVTPRSQKVLGTLLSQMADAEKAVLSSESIRLPAESVKQMRQELEPILKQATDFASRSVAGPSLGRLRPQAPRPL